MAMPMVLSEDGILRIRIEELPNGHLFSVYSDGSSYVIPGSRIPRHLQELVNGNGYASAEIDIGYRYSAGPCRKSRALLSDENVEIRIFRIR